VNATSRLNWLRWWWPAILWATLIFSFSTDAFSGENTSRVLIPFLHWLFPHSRWETLAIAHLVIRKCAHLTEYCLFGILILRGIRAGRPGWHWSWTFTALAAAAGWAGLDELHQAFVPSRGPSFIDVMIDTCGAIVGQLAYAAAVLLHSRRSRERRGVDSSEPIV